MKLSTSISLMAEKTNSRYFQGDGHLQAMRQCADAGYQLLDWDACDYAGPATPPAGSRLVRDDWRGFISAMRSQAEQLGVRFHQAHGLMFNYFMQDAQTAFLRRMEERVMLACAELGVENIVYHPIAPPQLQERMDTDGCKHANREYISRAAQRAGSLGLNIAIENMFSSPMPDGKILWRYCSNPAELADLVDSIGMQNVKICMDVGHAHIMKENLPDSFALYGKRLAALHIQDNDGASDQHLMPFHGTINWDSLMLALAECRYSGDLTFEIHNSLIRMPQELKDGMLLETVKVGHWLLERCEHYRSEFNIK